MSKAPAKVNVTQPEIAPTPVVYAPKEKVPEVDLKQLNLLVEKKKTYQISKRVNRVGLSLLMGLLFHFFAFTHNLWFLNLYTFIVIIFALYQAMDMFEQRAYTNKINVSLA